MIKNYNSLSKIFTNKISSFKNKIISYRKNKKCVNVYLVDVFGGTVVLIVD